MLIGTQTVKQPDDTSRHLTTRPVPFATIEFLTAQRAHRAAHRQLNANNSACHGPFEVPQFPRDRSGRSNDLRTGRRGGGAHRRTTSRSLVAYRRTNYATI